MRRFRRRAGAGGIWRILPGLLAAAFAVEDAGAERLDAASPVRAIEIEGNRSTDDELILRTLGVGSGSPVTVDRLRKGIRALWGLGIFSDVEIVSLPDPEGAAPGQILRVEVTERQRVSTLEILGNKKLGAEDLKGKISLRAGQMLDRARLWESCRAIEDAYGQEGYAGARCTPEVQEIEREQLLVRLQVAEGPRVKIAGVQIFGTEAFSEATLRGKLELKPNSLFRRKRYTAERYREDRARLERYYHNNGYPEAKASIAGADFIEDGERVILRYRIEEGPFVVFGERTWTGNETVQTEALDGAARFARGDPFSREKLDQTTAEAYNLYTDRGFLLEIYVSPETRTDRDTIHVDYLIREGRPSHVREVQIAGNRQTKERVIRREMTLYPGDLLRRSRLLRSQRDIMALGFFEDVAIDYEPTGEETDVDLVFRVKEKSTGSASGGVGYSSETGLTGFIQLGHPNLFGNGQSVSLQLERGGRRENYEISFHDPWIVGTPTAFGFDLFNTRRDRDLYTEKRNGGAIRLGRPWFYRFPDFTRIYVGYSIEDFTYSNFDRSLEQEESASDGVPIADRLRDSSGLISSAYVSMARNSTDNPFWPSLGAQTTVRLKLAGGVLSGDQHYIKPTIDHRIYFQPLWVPSLMLRWRAGWLAGLEGKAAPSTETFRLGGTRPFEYLRGYDDYYIVPEENVQGTGAGEVRFPGGSGMLAFTAEIQFPIVNPVRGLLFFDAGDTWNHSREIGLSGLKEAFGAGLRFEIPLLGQIGFDYGYGTAVDDWRFHFIIGSAF